MTLTELRKNIYSVFEEVLKTGKTIEIQSKGRSVLLSPGTTTNNKIERLRAAVGKRAIKGDPDDLVHIDWENEWHPRHI